MKQVDILTSLPLDSSIGPVQTIKRLVNSKDFFGKEGYEVNVFTRDSVSTSPHVSMRHKLMNYPAIRRAMEIGIHWLERNTVFWPKKTFDYYDHCARLMLERYFKLNRQPAVVVFHFFPDCYRYLKDYRIQGTKVVFFAHDDGTGRMLFYDYPKAKGSKLEIELNRQIQFIMENIDAKACITRTTEKNLLKRFPCLDGKTHLVINGISDLSANEIEETQQIRSKKKYPKYRFISTGSMSGRKGHREIIEALRQLNNDQLKDIKVTFLGGGSERASLEDLVSKYNLKETVEFVGVVPNSEVFRYQASCNIAILISKVEGLPLALLEGMRSGLALLSTNVSGIPEIIEEGVNGRMISPSIQELVEVFNHLDEYDWEKMGLESRKKFEDYYTFSRMRNDYTKMLDAVLG